MSKVIAGVYASGVLVASTFTFGAATALIAGYVSYSPFGWLTGVAFSGVPLGILLFVAARAEWRQKDISGFPLACIIAGVALMVLIGVFAHAETVAAILSVLQIATCVIGYFVVKNSNVPVAARPHGA